MVCCGCALGGGEPSSVDRRRKDMDTASWYEQRHRIDTTSVVLACCYYSSDCKYLVSILELSITTALP